MSDFVCVGVWKMLSQKLKAKEVAIIYNISRGYTATETAKKLGINYNTLLKILNKLYIKYRARNITHLVSKFYEEKLDELEKKESTKNEKIVCV
jgi:DNA-binding CsgD family transcriptional regulator